MTDPVYSRWPRPGEYFGKPDIITWWPRKMRYPYCIAPAMNVEWKNPAMERNPIGTFKWGKRLRLCDGLAWNHGEYRFSGWPDFVMYIQFRQVYDTFGHPILATDIDVVKFGVWKTGRGRKLQSPGQVVYAPWAAPYNINVHQDAWLTSPHALVRVVPVRLCDMWEESTLE